jgi:hypothetical protein
MFVRIRKPRGRLQFSLVETRRINGHVVHEHVAGLGSIADPPSIRDRLEFWKQLHERLVRLSNRVDPETQAKILGAICPTVPMVTADEQRALQLENAEADEQFWSTLEGLHASGVEDQKGLAATVERAIASGQEGAAAAAAQLAVARERVERIKKGEDVQGGLGKPPRREDFERILREAGVDPEHCIRVHKVCEAFGYKRVFETIMKAKDRSERKAIRDLDLLRQLIEDSEPE